MEQASGSEAGPVEACKPEEATQATLAQPSVKNDDEKLSETCRRHFQHVKLTDGRAAVPKLALLVPCVLAGLHPQEPPPSLQIVREALKELSSRKPGDYTSLDEAAFQELIRTVLQLKQQGKALRMESPKEMCMRLVRNPAILGVLLVAALLLIRFLSSSLLAVTSAATLKLLPGVLVVFGTGSSKGSSMSKRSTVSGGGAVSRASKAAQQPMYGDDDEEEEEPMPMDASEKATKLKAMLRADTVSDKDMEALYNVLQGNELDQVPWSEDVAELSAGRPAPKVIQSTSVAFGVVAAGEVAAVAMHQPQVMVNEAEGVVQSGAGTLLIQDAQLRRSLAPPKPPPLPKKASSGEGPGLEGVAEGEEEERPSTKLKAPHVPYVPAPDSEFKKWSKWATEAKAFGPQGPHHLKQSPLTKLRQSLDIRSSHGTSKSFTNMGLGKPSPVQTPGGSASPLVPNQHHLLGHGPSNHRKSLQISVGGMWAGLESPTAGSTGPKSGDVKKDKKVGSKVKALLKSKLSGGSRASSETVGSTSSTAATPTTDAPLMTAAADGTLVYELNPEVPRIGTGEDDGPQCTAYEHLLALRVLVKEEAQKAREKLEAERAAERAAYEAAAAAAAAGKAGSEAGAAGASDEQAGKGTAEGAAQAQPATAAAPAGEAPAADTAADGAMQPHKKSKGPLGKLVKKVKKLAGELEESLHHNQDHGHTKELAQAPAATATTAAAASSN